MVSMSLIPSGELKVENTNLIFSAIFRGINESNSLRGVERIAPYPAISIALSRINESNSLRGVESHYNPVAGDYFGKGVSMSLIPSGELKAAVAPLPIATIPRYQ